MRKLILFLVVVATVVVSCKEKADKKVAVSQEVVKEVVAEKVLEKAVVDNNIDIATSVVLWKGSKPTGSHNGTLKLVSGNMNAQNGNVISGEFILDMKSIADADGSEKLDGHLKSADFFDVEKYPVSKFVITSVEKKDTVIVTGDLTLKEVTKSITFPASITTVDGVTVLKSEVFEVNRTDFNVKYGSKSFFDNLKDKFIDDMMEISFEVASAK